MNFTNTKQSIIQQFSAKDGYKVVPFIVGAPGGGKSACAREIAQVLQEKKGIPDDRVIEFNPSLRDPVDIMGVPFKSEDGTHSEWLPPAEFYAIRSGQGPSILILEELSDAGVNMQNPLCRVILDRYAGQMKLSDELYIIATGNRIEDKSGANRLTTKLGNRMRLLEFDCSLDDWLIWAMKHDVDPMITSFIRYRPALLNGFDPKNAVNPTPRSWEDVSRIPKEFNDMVYFEHCKGAVGEGAASEYTMFLKTAKEMPDINLVFKQPGKVEIPKNPSVLYALCGAVEAKITEANFSKMWKFFERLPMEFQTMSMISVFRRIGSAILSNKDFSNWAIANGKLVNEFMG